MAQGNGVSRQELGSMAWAVYKGEERAKTLRDWKILPIRNNDYTHDDVTGFTGAVYKNQKSGQVVIAFRGSDNAELDLLKSGGQYFNGLIPNQYIAARAFVLDVYKTLPPNTPITLTGHSLGGILAQIAAVDPKLKRSIALHPRNNGHPPATTFSAPGVKSQVELLLFIAGQPFPKDMSAFDVENYVVDNDPIGKYDLHNHVGSVKILPAVRPTGNFSQHNPWHVLMTAEPLRELPEKKPHKPQFGNMGSLYMGYRGQPARIGTPDSMKVLLVETTMKPTQQHKPSVRASHPKPLQASLWR